MGRLTRATDSISGAIDFFYDNLDRLVLELSPQGAVAYEYDAIGRRITMTVAGQAPVMYQYDAASRLTQVAQGSLSIGIGYDAAGRRTTLTYPNGTSTSYTYDNASRLLTITHNGPAGVIESLTYTYDAAGNRTSLTRANGAASVLPASVTSATYDAANQQTAFAGTTHTFDANGNLTNDGTNTYTWDARNRLIGISGGATANFVYDPLGRRESKTIGGTTTQFVYDGNDIAQEIQGGTVAAAYLRSLNIDEPFIRQTGVAHEYYHADALGSSLVLSNAAGGSVTTYAYEPFGKTTVAGTNANTLQFTGRENDGTGLYYYRARYYSPLLPRFTNEDSLDLSEIILLAQGDQTEVPDPEFIALLRSTVLANPLLGNRYSYALSNPVNFSDPTGEIIPQLIGCTLGAGISVGVDVFSGRKINLLDASLGCALGAFGGFGYGKAFKFGLHDPHHYFPLFGRNLSHFQVNWWQKGVSGSGNAFRIPIPPSIYKIFKP
ncbi:hypothetical protein W02_11560 [Nitrospira sp. KM1]|nr:hypothetical protein W02_11560 [Nitrospira sp. KM1]